MSAQPQLFANAAPTKATKTPRSARFARQAERFPGVMMAEVSSAMSVEENDRRAGDRSRLFRNTATYAAAQALTWTVTLLTIKTIPQRLGEAAMGQITVSGLMVMPAGNLLMVAIESYLSKEVGRDPAHARRLLRAVLGLRLALLPVAMAAGTASLLISLWLIDRGAHGGHNESYTLALLAIVQLAHIPLMFLTQPFGAVMIGMERARDYSVVSFIQQIYPIFALPFLALGPISMVGASLFAWIVTGIYSVWWGARTLSIRPLFDRALFWRLTRRGAPFMVNGYILLLYLAGATVVLLQHGGEAAVGVFGQAGRLAGFAQAAPAVLAPALLPMIARVADSSRAEFAQLQVRILGLLIAVGVPVSVLFFQLAHPLSLLIYGPHRFAEAPLALQMCALNIVPLYLVSMLYQFLIAQDRTGLWTWFLLGTVLLNWLACLVLVPWMERAQHNPSAGAALASFIAECGTLLAALITLRIRIAHPEIVSRVARATVAGFVMFGAMWLTRGLFLVVPAAAGVLAYLVMAWIVRLLTPDERAMIASRVGNRFARLTGR